AQFRGLARPAHQPVSAPRRFGRTPIAGDIMGSVKHVAGVYIHIPFCERKCVYCNFNTTDFNSRLAARYISAVESEIRQWGRILAGPSIGAGAPSKLPIDSILFGGGTPSTLSAGQLARLIEACADWFEVCSDAEITIEINPSPLHPRDMADWRQGGVNRASVGIQLFIH